MDLYYRKEGNAGPPMVIVHGLYGASDNWLGIAREFSDDYEVFLPDQRNHGNSAHDPVHTYDAMREDLKDFLDSQDIDKAILLGHSMGGKTVMSFALKYPERVLSLIVVDIAPVSYTERSSTSKLSANHSKMIDAMLDLDLAKMESREDISKALSVKIGSERIRMFLLKNITRNKKKEFEWKINLPALKKNLPEIMGNISLDGYEENGGARGFAVLFIRGENSDYLLPEDNNPILKLFPTTEFVSIPNSGHWVHSEQPDLFVKNVKYFLG